MSTKLKNILTSIFAKMTGGRPMTYLAYAMTDEVSGTPVYYYKDFYKRTWMAENKWSWFRVRCNYDEADILMLDELFEDTWKDKPSN